MQRTRLNTLVELTGARLELLFSNPWRRIALSIISLLFGFFMGSAIATTLGQDAVWDIVAAAVVLVGTELTSKIFYSRQNRQSTTSLPIRRSLLWEMLNLFKIGLMYNLFLEAFKLGS